MLWQALHSQSLWANYFRGKYIKGAHLTAVMFNNMSGLAKRSWSKAKHLILQHHKSVIGDGTNTSFWYDKWLGDFTLAEMASPPCRMDPKATVKDVLLQPPSAPSAFPNNGFPMHIANALRKLSLIPVKDMQICSLTINGNCTINSTFKQLCSNSGNQEIIPWARISSKWLPSKISNHIWKIMHNCLPTDSNIKRSGIALCSKCCCCTNPQVEDPTHLFKSSNMATYLWTHFRSKGISLHGTTISRFIQNIINTNPQNTMYGLFSLAVLGYGLWEIWLSINKARYDNQHTSNQALLYKVLYQVKQICSLAQLKEPPNRNWASHGHLSNSTQMGRPRKIMKQVVVVLSEITEEMCC